MNRSKRSRWWLALGLILAAAPATPGTVPSATAKPVTIWLMPNENLEADSRTAAQFRSDFQQKNIYILNDLDSELWLKILKQQAILGLLAEYSESNSVQINVCFIDWGEAYGLLENFSYEADICQMPSTWLSHFAEAEKLELVKCGQTEGYHPAALGSCMLGSDNYGIPWLYDFRLLYWRRDILPIGSQSDIGHWELFEKVVNADSPLVIPLNSPWNLLQNLFIFCLNGRDGGHDIFQRYWLLGDPYLELSDGNKLNDQFNSVVQRLIANGADRRIVFFRGDVQEAEDEFIHLRYSMIITGPQFIEKLYQAYGENWNARVGITWPPGECPAEARFTFLGGSHLCIIRRNVVGARPGDDPENTEVGKLFNYLTGRSFLIAYAKSTGLMMAYKEDELYSPMLTNRAFASDSNTVMQIMERGRCFPVAPQMAVMEKEFGHDVLFQFVSALTGERTVELDKISQELIFLEDHTNRMVNRWYNFIHTDLWWVIGSGTLILLISSFLIFLAADLERSAVVRFNIVFLPIIESLHELDFFDPCRKLKIMRRITDELDRAMVSEPIAQPGTCRYRLRSGSTELVRWLHRCLFSGRELAGITDEALLESLSPSSLARLGLSLAYGKGDFQGNDAKRLVAEIKSKHQDIIPRELRDGAGPNDQLQWLNSLAANLAYAHALGNRGMGRLCPELARMVEWAAQATNPSAIEMMAAMKQARLLLAAEFPGQARCLLNWVKNEKDGSASLTWKLEGLQEGQALTISARVSRVMVTNHPHALQVMLQNLIRNSLNKFIRAQEEGRVIPNRAISIGMAGRRTIAVEDNAGPFDAETLALINIPSEQAFIGRMKEVLTKNKQEPEDGFSAPMLPVGIGYFLIKLGLNYLFGGTLRVEPTEEGNNRVSLSF